MAEATYSFDTMTRAQARALFPNALVAAMHPRRGRRWTQKALALALGVRTQTVAEWQRGERFPSVRYAPRLAEYLASQYVAELVLLGSRVECAICGKVVYAANKGAPRLYCSSQCKAAANDRRKRGATVLRSHLSAHRLEEHQQAVHAFCLECEPDGVCQRASCPLRPVSPLPLEAPRQHPPVLTLEGARRQVLARAQSQGESLEPQEVERRAGHLLRSDQLRHQLLVSKSRTAAPLPTFTVRSTP